MVDAHALGACGLGRAGSNPASPTRGGFSMIVGSNRGRLFAFTTYRPFFCTFPRVRASVMREDPNLNH